LRYPIFKISTTAAILLLLADMFKMSWWLAVPAFAALIAALLAAFFEKDAIISAKK